jgi:hypothetical protein
MNTKKNSAGTTVYTGRAWYILFGASVSEKCISVRRRDLLDGGRPAIHPRLDYERVTRLLMDDITTISCTWVLCILTRVTTRAVL